MKAKRTEFQKEVRKFLRKVLPKKVTLKPRPAPKEPIPELNLDEENYFLEEKFENFHL